MTLHGHNEDDVGEIPWRVYANLRIRFRSHCAHIKGDKTIADDMLQSAVTGILEMLQSKRICFDGYHPENHDSDEYKATDRILRNLSDNVRDAHLRPHRLINPRAKDQPNGSTEPKKIVPQMISIGTDDRLADHRSVERDVDCEDEIAQMIKACSKPEKAVAHDLISDLTPPEIQKKQQLTRYKYDLIIERLHTVLSTNLALRTSKPECREERKEEKPGVTAPLSTSGSPETTT